MKTLVQYSMHSCCRHAQSSGSPTYAKTRVSSKHLSHFFDSFVLLSRGLPLPPRWPKFPSDMKFVCQRRISFLVGGFVLITRRTHLCVVVIDPVLMYSCNIWAFSWRVRFIFKTTLLLTYWLKETCSQWADSIITRLNKYFICDIKINTWRRELLPSQQK